MNAAVQYVIAGVCGLALGGLLGGAAVFLTGMAFPSIPGPFQ